jgi:cobalt-zinc-cadmium efflux system protein
MAELSSAGAGRPDAGAPPAGDAPAEDAAADAGAAFDGAAPGAAGPAAPRPPREPRDEPPSRRESFRRWTSLLSGWSAVRSVLRQPQVAAAVDDLLDRALPSADRTDAARTLARLSRPETLEALAAAALEDPDPLVSHEARTAFERVAGAWRKTLLREAGYHPMPGRRVAALRALGAEAALFEAPAAVERLGNSAAMDGDTDARLTAVEQLASAQSPKALSLLYRLRDAEPAGTSLHSALELAVARAEARHAKGALPLAAYRPPTGDLASDARKPMEHSALKKVIGVAAFFTAIELAGGVATGSVSLQADSFHLAADLAINVGALAALWMARRPPNSRKTYGYLKLESIVGLVSSAAIAGMGLFTGFEALGRLLHPAAVPALETMILACSGLLSNALSTWLLYRYRDDSLSLKGAFLHAATDAVGSLGIIAGSGLILAFGWLWADPLISFGIVALILHTTWDLAVRSWNVLIDAVPPGVELDALERELAALPGIVSVYDLHVWSLNSTERAATVQLFIREGADHETAAQAAKALLAAKGIGHSTVEVRRLPAKS